MVLVSINKSPYTKGELFMGNEVIFFGIITMECKIVEVCVNEDDLRSLKPNEASFCCSVTSETIVVVFSPGTPQDGSRFVIHKIHGDAVKTWARWLKENENNPEFEIAQMLDVFA
jgi:hypothetical protein